MIAAPDGIRAVVPVKDTALAKQRLAGCLSPGDRRALVLAMLRDVIAALRAAGSVAGIVVATSDARAARIARDAACEVRPDADGCRDLSGAVAAAASALGAAGVRRALVLPADLPRVRAAEIDAVAAALPAGGGIVLVPDRRGDGTNALLLDPASPFGFAFGPGSFGRHRDEARRLGRPARVVAMPSLAFDLDTEDDLRGLLSEGGEGDAVRRLRGRLERALAPAAPEIPEAAAGAAREAHRG